MMIAGFEDCLYVICIRKSDFLNLFRSLYLQTLLYIFLDDSRHYTYIYIYICIENSYYQIRKCFTIFQTYEYVFIYFLMGFIDWFVLYLNCDVKLYKVVLKLLKFHLGSFWYILNF